jgi:hypothetical protein
MPDALERPLTPNVFLRLAQATRYAITGVGPDSWFGPQQPLQPQAPPDVKGRQFDYPFGANLNYTPRSEGGISFAELRALADALPLLRAVIETRKDQIAAQNFTVRARARSDLPEESGRIDKALALLASPDRRRSFGDWLRMLLEDLLVIDAATIYPRYDRGGNLFALDVIDGTTIKPLIGEDGRTPEPPDPAYQQVLHGVPAADFSADELLYLPRNVRAHRLYGMGPVEQVALTVNIALRREVATLDYYRTGSSPVEARDQSQIDAFGPRVGSVIEAREICDEHTMGPSIAQAILQRELYVRTRFSFKLSAEYCLLDPMDIVTITDTNLGLSNYPIRIIEIEEDDKGLLAFTAEELVFGVSSPAVNPSATASSYPPNASAPAVAVNAPLIYQPPLAATGGVPQIWFGASGVSAGGQNQWGGCYVWLSNDGVTFTQIPATIEAPVRQGVLTGPLLQESGWDTGGTLSVDLSISGGTLTGTTQAAAQQGATLSLVNSELLSYQNATLISGSAYDVTGLARGLSTTAAAYHSSGASFYRLDSAILKYDVPANLQGHALFFKFQSFNAWGGGLQDLSTCSIYTFTPNGVSDPIALQLSSGFSLDLGLVLSGPSVSDDFGAVQQPVNGAIDLGPISGPAHAIAANLLTGAPLDLGSTTSYPTVSDDFGAVVDPVIDNVNLGATT